MPLLRNQRHELFAQALVGGASATQAYKDAGYSVRSDNTAAVNGKRLLTNAQIKGRCEELRSRVASGLQITRQKVLEELAVIGLAPVDHKHIKAADKRAALMDIAKLEGWVIDRSEHGKPGDFDRLNDDELAEFITTRTGRVGAGNPRTGSARHPEDTDGAGRLN